MDRVAGQLPRGLVNQGRLPGEGEAARQDWGDEEERTRDSTHPDKDMKTDL